MAERPGFRPRQGTPLVGSPALPDGVDDGRRQSIRQELYDRLVGDGQQRARPKRFISDPTQPDMMPVRMALGPGGEPMPGGPEGMGGPGGSDEVMALIEQEMGPDIVGAPPEFIEDFRRVLTRLKSEGFPMIAQVGKKVRAGLMAGKSVDQVHYEVRMSMGGQLR